MLCPCDAGDRMSEKLHSEVQERTINTNLLPARWATSSQVGVVSIAVNAIYLMYWPITTSPLCVPTEGSPAVSQQGHRRTIDWGVVLFLQADPHSCFCLFLFLYRNPLLPSAYSSPSLPPSICLPVPGSLYLTRSLPPSIPWPFSASVSSLSVDCLKAHCHSALAKINNIILIQTDIKRQRASKPFLCRLIMSPCFSTPFIFSRLVPSIFSLEDSSGFQLPGMSEQSLDVTFDADKFGRVAVCPRAPVSDISRLCDKYLRYWHTKVLLLQHGEKHALNVILIFHKLSQE